MRCHLLLHGVGLVFLAFPSAATAASNASPALQGFGYPLYALAHGIEGTVIVSVRVDPDGTPEDVVLDRGSGQKILDDFAVGSAYFVKYARSENGGVRQERFVFQLGKHNFDPFTVKAAPFHRPRYPDVLRSEIKPGYLLLDVLIGEGGFVRDVHIVHPSGNNGLDAVTLWSIYEWRFDTTQEQSKVGQISHQTVLFRGNIED